MAQTREGAVASPHSVDPLVCRSIGVSINTKSRNLQPDIDPPKFLEHFARWPVVREVGNHKLSLGLAASEPLRFVLLDRGGSTSSDVLRRAAYLHALYRAPNALRYAPSLNPAEVVLGRG